LEYCLLRFLTGCYKATHFATGARFKVQRARMGKQNETQPASRAALCTTPTTGGRVSQLRFGAADLISIRPLVQGLKENGASLGLESPPALVDSLLRGRYDAALVPAIEYLRGAGLFMVVGPALVGRPTPGGIVLLSQKPLEELERVAVGEFCRTPVAALRIVLGELHKIFPDLLVEKRIDEDDWRDRYDAALLTGDAALREVNAPAVKGLTRYNITEMWRTVTKTPLVHAVWAYNDAARGDEIKRALVDSRRAGLDKLPALCDEIAGTSGLDAMTIHDYLSRSWSYDLGEKELVGLRALNDHACRYDLIRESRLAVAAQA
jgi:predicted solute-binding protein